MGKARFDFADQVVIVTGANGNLGSAVADAFAATGASLVLVGRNADRVAEALPHLSAASNVMFAPSTDLTDVASVNSMVEKVLDRFGRIHILANTVGGYRAGHPVHETAPEAWDFMMALNARSAFVSSRAVVPSMLDGGYGKIIHTASRAALQGSRNAAAYAASKAALLRLTEVLATELKEQDINVNCILPGTLDTQDNRDAMPNADHSRWVSPEAVAQLFLFLSSDGSKTLHGAAIPAYGLS